MLNTFIRELGKAFSSLRSIEIRCPNSSSIYLLLCDGDVKTGFRNAFCRLRNSELCVLCDDMSKIRFRNAEKTNRI